MAEWFKVGDRVSWNSKGGRVSGTIIRVHMRDFDCRGHTHHANPTLPRYEIKSSKTDHIAPHRGSALTKLRDRQIADGDRRESSDERESRKACGGRASGSCAYRRGRSSPPKSLAAASNIAPRIRISRRWISVLWALAASLPAHRRNIQDSGALP